MDVVGVFFGGTIAEVHCQSSGERGRRESDIRNILVFTITNRTFVFVYQIRALQRLERRGLIVFRHEGGGSRAGVINRKF